MSHPQDFKHVFVSELGEKGAQQKTTVQCSALLTSSNATVRELLTIPFRATYWSSKPASFLPFLDEWDRLYDLEDMEEDEFWIAELFEPVRPAAVFGDFFQPSLFGVLGWSAHRTDAKKANKTARASFQAQVLHPAAAQTAALVVHEGRTHPTRDHRGAADGSSPRCQGSNLEGSALIQGKENGSRLWHQVPRECQSWLFLHLFGDFWFYLFLFWNHDMLWYFIWYTYLVSNRWVSACLSFGMFWPGLMVISFIASWNTAAMLGSACVSCNPHWTSDRSPGSFGNATRPVAPGATWETTTTAARCPGPRWRAAMALVRKLMVRVTLWMILRMEDYII